MKNKLKLETYYLSKNLEKNNGLIKKILEILPIKYNYFGKKIHLI